MPTSELDLVAILDVETSGLSPETDYCVEVAVVTYSLRYASVVQAHSWLLKQLTNTAAGINGIDPCVLRKHGEVSACVWLDVDLLLAEGVRVILAHIAEFDRSFALHGSETKAHACVRDLPWVDTCHGITWPRQHKPSMPIVNLALAHGVPVVGAHRALGDCLLLASLLTRCAELGHDIQALVAQGLRPQATFALVDYENAPVAREQHGFHFHAADKSWLRRMAVEDAAKLPFAVRQVGGGDR